jgi:hypothetical protein
MHLRDSALDDINKTDLVDFRTSSQKPGDEFIANFRQSFPVVSSQGSPTSGNTSLDAIAPQPLPDR